VLVGKFVQFEWREGVVVIEHVSLSDFWDLCRLPGKKYHEQVDKTTRREEGNIREGLAPEQSDIDIRRKRHIIISIMPYHPS
jgi:hypothetical protein